MVSGSSPPVPSAVLWGTVRWSPLNTGFTPLQAEGRPLLLRASPKMPFSPQVPRLPPRHPACPGTPPPPTLALSCRNPGNTAGPFPAWAGVPRFLAPFRSDQSPHSPGTAVRAPARGPTERAHVPLGLAGPGGRGRNSAAWAPPWSLGKWGLVPRGLQGPLWPGGH